MSVSTTNCPIPVRTDLSQGAHKDIKTRRAVAAKQTGKYQLIETRLPEIGPGMVLVKTAAVALNPADAKTIDYSATVGAIGGIDFSGVVVSLGDGVKRLKIGDPVCGMVFGLNPSDSSIGAFSNYVGATEDLICRLPDSMSFEEGASLGAGVGTAGLALYQSLGLPMPDKPAVTPFYVLIYGGSTATGTLAIQLVKASGLIPLAVCSPYHFDLVKSLGAEEAFDYRSPTCGSDIRSYTSNKLAHALDCITDTKTMKICYDSIGTAGGKYTALDPYSTRIKYTRRNIKADWLMVYTLLGDPVRLAGVYARPANPGDRKFSSLWYPLAERLIAEGKLKHHPIEIKSGGLLGVMDGIDELRTGMVKGKKLVYLLDSE
ncbi:hypothetical protein BP5796_07010 [Coleophoma crateriformis]|uniref:Enoyl reductase (ER) domain-containing protein n=1 Tax=Coleophoma crateriformis TaxID=565419 RepID=A0A3D8RQ60_9HELO|nr:hypothetical protein BP5796_07010 [Coleophoma crateriformis]